MKCKQSLILLSLVSASMLCACSSTGYSGYSATSNPSRDVYNTQGQRIAHIDGQGNIYATQSSKGVIAGQRVGKIK